MAKEKEKSPNDLQKTTQTENYIRKRIISSLF